VYLAPIKQLVRNLAIVIAKFLKVGFPVIALGPAQEVQYWQVVFSIGRKKAAIVPKQGEDTSDQ
jgi:hypothetical protein